MDRATYPYVTTSSAITLFDRANSYRPLLWLDAPGQVDWLNQQDNGLLLKLLEVLPSTEQEFNQPKYEWIEENRLEVATQLTSAMTASATTMVLDDPYICIVNSRLVSPADGEIMRVTAVNYGTSTITVVRGVGGTASTAKAADAYIVAMPAFMAELSDPNLGVGQLPGLPMYNYISTVSQGFKVSRTQQNSEMYDGWGQVPRAQMEQVLDLRRKLCYALLFNARETYATANEGQMYISGGAVNYIKSNMLDLGPMANKFNWATLNDFLYNLFYPDASSPEKTMIAGPTLFATAQKMMRDLGRLENGMPYFEPKLGTQVFTIRTDEGNTVNCLLDKFGLSPRYGLGDWGFVFDLAHMGGGHFKGMDFQWFQNIQDNRSVNIREDAYMGSFSMYMKHESTHGIIRGGAGRTVVR